MSAAIDLYPQQSRVAKKVDLLRVEYTNNINIGAQSLSKLARSWIAWYLSVVRMGYTSIEACQGAIGDSYIRSVGESVSRASYYRAQRQLEDLGFISRPTYKQGLGMTIIKINTSRFEFWLMGERRCDIIPHVSERDPLVLSNTPIPDLSSNLNLYSNSYKSKNHANKNKKHATKQKKVGRDFATWIHPVLYSVLAVLRDSMAMPNQTAIVSACKEAIAGRNGRTINPRYTPEYWQSLPVPYRELIAKNEIIPDLLVLPGTGEFSALRLLSAARSPISANNANHPGKIEPVIELSRSDLAILTAAKLRAQQRKV